MLPTRPPYDALRTNLEEVGVKVEVVSASWNGGYLENATAGKYDAYLLGWTGDYDAAFNFIGTFFGNLKENDFGTEVMPWGEQASQDLQDAERHRRRAGAGPCVRDDQPADQRGAPSPVCRSATRRRPWWSDRTWRVWWPAR